MALADDFKEFVRLNNDALSKVSTDLQATNIASAKVETKLDAALHELDLARKERDELKNAVATLKAKLAGSASTMSAWAVWLGVVFAAAALVVSIVK